MYVAQLNWASFKVADGLSFNDFRLHGLWMLFSGRPFNSNFSISNVCFFSLFTPESTHYFHSRMNISYTATTTSLPKKEKKKRRKEKKKKRLLQSVLAYCSFIELIKQSWWGIPYKHSRHVVCKLSSLFE